MIALSIVGLVLLPTTAFPRPSRALPHPTNPPKIDSPKDGDAAAYLAGSLGIPAGAPGSRPSPTEDEPSSQGRAQEEEEETDDLPDDPIESLARLESIAQARSPQKANDPVRADCGDDLGPFVRPTSSSSRGKAAFAGLAPDHLPIRLCRLTC